MTIRNCGRGVVAAQKSVYTLHSRCSGVLLSLLVALQLLSWETIVDCRFEWLQIHGLDCCKVWFVVVLIPLYLSTHANQSSDLMDTSG